MSEEKKLRNIDELGEFALIDQLTNQFENRNPNTLLGIGDDAAVIALSETESLLLSTDSLVESVHFNLKTILKILN
jgi:thiamine-monophosphate kinase